METPTLPADERQLSAPTLLIIARAGGKELARATLAAGGELTVGSDDSNSLVISHGQVSRKHLLLRHLGTGVLAKDLGSKNGTKLQDARLTEAMVPVGAALLLGAVELRLEPLDAGEVYRLGELETRSPLMRKTLETLARAATKDVTILIEGETGTGKDVCARAVHAASPRAKGPLETVDCGAFSRELAAAELFGHEKGAFTGADRAREGALERSDGGTLFLDEVGELPLELQPLLLRALEARKVKRVGGDQYVPFDVRIIAATHRDLDAQVKSGAFRADLLHRLAVVRVRVPRLAERLEDLPLLARAIIASLGERARGFSLSPSTLALLESQPWPGNVRELRNFLERASALGLESEPGDPSQPGAAWPVDYAAARDRALEAFEKDFASFIVKRAEGNVSKAAKEAGMNRAYLHRLIKRHAL
ncbi:MAG: sigma 54-interacting transcriptional regulator [Archangium sp.]|nr:sigma 54-interacting transcriptional regulator [Archangium sp.]